MRFEHVMGLITSDFSVAQAEKMAAMQKDKEADLDKNSKLRSEFAEKLRKSKEDAAEKVQPLPFLELTLPFLDLSQP